ncbi:ACP S-malonyltransferase [Sutterella sp.]|uniref:ACP S-malonyltransferase n=1 Tax=Sutterella sp. TaxID=1981025 RepID=UPI0026DFC4DD|nr:ACP S-malonyltransferase [Sutterella sp.]MDO5531090.1 ACP S-malonyltransferase [Sutterella sp.]
MRLAFVFPGQGSQSVGMLNGFAGNAVVEDHIARADAALGFPISKLIAEGPAEELGLTVNTQPALLTASVAFYDAWIAAGGEKPEIMAGHSLGEYSALTAAGAIGFDEAVKLVRFRATAMQSAVPVGVGGMCAVIGLDDATVVECCREASAIGPVEAVNFNSPGQVVIAGEKAALERAAELVKEKGCRRAIPLAVSGPFHSSMLAPAREALAGRLAETEVKAPAIPVIANVNAEVHGSPDEIRAALALQVCSAVQWVKTIEKMAALGITDIVECGPGKVLQGLIRRIAPSIRIHGVSDQASLEATMAKLAELRAAE